MLLTQAQYPFRPTPVTSDKRVVKSFAISDPQMWGPSKDLLYYLALMKSSSNIISLQRYFHLQKVVIIMIFTSFIVQPFHLRRSQTSPTISL